jgi:hypothetical protein
MQAIREEVKYDMQILADRIEFYWTHLTGIGTLENSLWGWDGEQIRVWLNALTIDGNKLVDRTSQAELENVEESLAIPVDFYPLCEPLFSDIDGMYRALLILFYQRSSWTKASLSASSTRHAFAGRSTLLSFASPRM